MGLGILIPGTGPGTGPTVLPSVGVTGYSHRFCGYALSGADGAALTSSNWGDIGGSAASYTVTVGSGGSATINRPAASFPYVRFINDAYLRSSDSPSVGSAAIVFRNATGLANTALSQVMQLAMLTAAGGVLQLKATGSFTTALSPGNGWNLALFSSDGSGNVAVRLNGQEVTNAGAPTPIAGAANAKFGVGVNVSGGTGTNGTQDFTEWVTWDRALTATERATVYTNLKSAYGLA